MCGYRVANAELLKSAYRFVVRKPTAKRKDFFTHAMLASHCLEVLPRADSQLLRPSSMCPPFASYKRLQRSLRFLMAFVMNLLDKRIAVRRRRNKY